MYKRRNKVVTFAELRIGDKGYICHWDHTYHKEIEGIRIIVRENKYNNLVVIGEWSRGVAMGSREWTKSFHTQLFHPAYRGVLVCLDEETI